MFLHRRALSYRTLTSEGQGRLSGGVASTPSDCQAGLTAGAHASINLLDSCTGAKPSDCQAGLTAGVRASINLLDLCTGVTPSDCQVGLTTGVRAATNLSDWCTGLATSVCLSFGIVLCRLGQIMNRVGRS